MRNTLAWSYDLLHPHEQRLFRRLCVFVGNFTLEASEAVYNVAQDLELSVLDGLASLLDKSLLYQVEQGAGEPRFVMLETIREYGLECLEANGETITTKRACSMYYLMLAEQAEQHLSSREQRVWLQCLELAYDNLRTALFWLIEQAETELSLRLACALWHFWWMRGQVIEGYNWLEQVLALPPREKTSITHFRSRALSALGTLAGLQGDLEQAERLCQESLAVSRQLGDMHSIATALWMLGYVAREKSNYVLARTLAQESLQLARNARNMQDINYSLETLAAVALDQGNYQEARTLIEESLEICRQVGDIWETARSLWLLALALLFQGDITQARKLLEESLVLSREINDKRSIAYTLVMLGYVAYFQGQQERMYTLMEEALVSHKEAGNQRGRAESLHGLAWATLAQGDAVKAQVLFEESLVILNALDRKWFQALALDGLAAAVAMQGQPVWATRLWGAAESLREWIRAKLAPIIQTLYEPFLALAHAQLSDKEFAAAWAEGHALVVDAVPARALFHAPEPALLAASLGIAPVVVTKYPARLTAREVEVLRWVTLGLTDIQVAEKLVISSRTVSTHLTSIYSKLGTSSRSAATRYAMEHHLV